MRSPCLRWSALPAILVQSPLPAGMGPNAEQRVFDTIDPIQDVDGFHPVNAGRLVQKRPAMVACTPLGVYRASRARTDSDRRAPRGRYRPQRHRRQADGLLLLHRDATVTLCHSKTADLPGSPSSCVRSRAKDSGEIEGLE